MYTKCVSNRSLYTQLTVYVVTLAPTYELRETSNPRRCRMYALRDRLLD